MIPIDKNSRLAVFALGFILLVILGCGAVTDGKPAAELAIARFHSMLNDERYEEIYAGLDPQFKEVSTEQEMLEILQAIHSKLGKVTSTTNQTWRANSYNLETQLLMVQDTEFERGKAVETFTFLYADKKVSLVGYNIDSRELITK